MLLWYNPGLKRKTRSVWGQRQEVFIFCDDPNTRFGLLSNHVAKHAPLFVDEVLLSAFNFFSQVNGQHGQRNQLGVRMFEGGAGSLAVILENQNVLETPVFF